MWRFAATVTILMILLTAIAASLFSIDGDSDAFLTTDDLKLINMPFEEHKTQRQNRFEVLLGYDSNTTLLKPRMNAWVSVRVDQADIDFAARRRREENWATKPGFGNSTICDDPGQDDAGYMVRHRNEKSARCELVRYRGGRMLVVKVSRNELVGTPEEELAACERRARIIQERMLEKLRWWSAAATDDRR
jgi:hypothetical protein